MSESCYAGIAGFSKKAFQKMAQSRRDWGVAELSNLPEPNTQTHFHKGVFL